MSIYINFKLRRAIFSALVLFVSAVSNQAYASIVIDGTRVIFPSEKSEVSVRMTNQGEDPKLVQVWIDDGDKDASPDKIKVPFIVLTPIFRMDPKKGQVTRIQYLNNMPLPSDKESVFWLNVLEIPAKPEAKEKDENYIQFRYRTRIKLFYRPTGLAGTSEEAPEKLIFKYKPGHVQVENPTAYYISISSLEVGENAVGGKAESQMVEPFSTKLLPLTGSAQVIQSPKVKFKTINDYGGAPVREKTATAL